MPFFNIFDIIFPKSLQLNVTGGQSAPFPITSDNGIEIFTEWQTFFKTTGNGIFGLTNDTGFFQTGSFYITGDDPRTNTNKAFGITTLILATDTGSGLFRFDPTTAFWSFRCYLYNSGISGVLITGSDGIVRIAGVYSDWERYSSNQVIISAYSSSTGNVVTATGSVIGSGNIFGAAPINLFPYSSIIDGIAIGTQQTIISNIYSCSDGFSKDVILGGQLYNPSTSSSNITLSISCSGTSIINYTKTVPPFSYMSIYVTGQFTAGRAPCTYYTTIQVNTGIGLPGTGSAKFQGRLTIS